jgi:hypothetical protein
VTFKPARAEPAGGRGPARSVLNLGDLREDFAAKEPDVVGVRDVVQVEVDGVGACRAELGQAARMSPGVPVTPMASIRASASPRAAAPRAAWPLDPGVDLQRGDLPTGRKCLSDSWHARGQGFESP